MLTVNGEPDYDNYIGPNPPDPPITTAIEDFSEAACGRNSPLDPHDKFLERRISCFELSPRVSISPTQYDDVDGQPGLIPVDYSPHPIPIVQRSILRPEEAAIEGSTNATCNWDNFIDSYNGCPCQSTIHSEPSPRILILPIRPDEVDGQPGLILVDDLPHQKPLLKRWTLMPEEKYQVFVAIKKSIVSSVRPTGRWLSSLGKLSCTESLQSPRRSYWGGGSSEGWISGSGWQPQDNTNSGWGPRPKIWYA